MIKTMAGTICAAVVVIGLSLPAGNAAAQNFATTASNADEFTAQASELAAKSGDDRLSALAAQMTSDQQRNKSQLQTLTGGGGDEPASNAHKLDGTHQQMLDQLKTKTGDEFKSAYVHDLIDEQQKQIATYQNYMQRGADPKLKGWAAQNVPRLRSRLKQLEEIARED